MAHIAPQTSLRVVKTYLWHHNVVLPTKQFPNEINGDLSHVRGLEKLLKHFLRKRRFFILKANVRYCSLQAKQLVNLLFLPKMKQSPKKYIKRFAFGALLKKRYRFQNLGFRDMFLGFIALRRLKIFKFPPERKAMQINRWINKRITRGFSSFKYNSSTNLQRYVIDKNFLDFCRLRVKKNTKYIFVKDALYSWYNAGLKVQEEHPFRKSWCFKKRWIFWPSFQKKYLLIKRFVKKRQLSCRVGRLLYRKFKLKTLNVFEYMTLKGLINFRKLQKHFWHFRYKNRRFHFFNYFDIINSFLILGLINNT